MNSFQRAVSTSAKFPLGNLAVTATALAQLSAEDMLAAIARHAQGDWGDVDVEDRNENQRSLRAGNRLLSVYRSASGRKFWIITEADRSVTTILLPEDY